MNNRRMRPTVVIGLDDTDNADSIGTGRLGRMLAERLVDAGYRLAGVTRHQHLLHPDIPYTSHNSSCAIALTSLDAVVEPANALVSLKKLCEQFLVQHWHEGADPGLCVAAVEQITQAAVVFARRTQREVLTKSDAERVARDGGILLSEHGGTGQGIIGALAAAALRSGGNDGRFLDLPGLRDLTGTLTVAEILRRTPISHVIDDEARLLDQSDHVVTGAWVRPLLRDHRPVLVVHRTAAGTWNCGKTDE